MNLQIYLLVDFKKKTRKQSITRNKIDFEMNIYQAKVMNVRFANRIIKFLTKSVPLVKSFATQLQSLSKNQ